MEYEPSRSHQDAADRDTALADIKQERPECATLQSSTDLDEQPDLPVHFTQTLDKNSSQLAADNETNKSAADSESNRDVPNTSVIQELVERATQEPRTRNKKGGKNASAERVEKTTRKLRARQSAAAKEQNTQRSSPQSQPTRETRSRQTKRKPQSTKRVWRLDIVGDAVDKWRDIGNVQGLVSDTEIAVFLMQHYQNSLSGQPVGTACINCQSLLTLTCCVCHTPSQFLDTARTWTSTSSHEDPAPAKTGGGGEGEGEKTVVTKPEPSDPDPESAGEDAADPDYKYSYKYVKRGKFMVAAEDGLAWNYYPTEVVRRRRTSAEIQAARQNPPLQVLPDQPPLPQPGPAGEGHELRKLPVGRRRNCAAGHEGRPIGSGKKGLKLKERKYKCTHQDCDASFTKSSRLKCHIRIHSGEKPYKCLECGKAFTQKSGLNVHMNKHTGLRPFSCPECHATFPSSSTLKQHLRRHTGEKPYMCTKCDKKFRWSGHLTQHMRMHDGIKPFLCPDCGKSFAASSDLVKHRVTHTKDRPFKCDKCDRAYSFQHRLTAHMRSHTGDRPFLCTICGSAFARAHNLTVHMRTHTGDKPYMCKECGAKFADSGNFSKHKKIKHGAPGRGGQAGANSTTNTTGARSGGANPADSSLDDQEDNTTDYLDNADHSRNQSDGEADTGGSFLDYSQVGVVERRSANKMDYSEDDHPDLKEHSRTAGNSGLKVKLTNSQASEMSRMAALAVQATSGGRLPGMAKLVNNAKLNRAKQDRDRESSVASLAKMFGVDPTLPTHDLNTPAVPSTSYTSLLMRESASPSDMSHLNRNFKRHLPDVSVSGSGAGSHLSAIPAHVGLNPHLSLNPHFAGSPSHFIGSPSHMVGSPSHLVGSPSPLPAGTDGRVSASPSLSPHVTAPPQPSPGPGDNRVSPMPQPAHQDYRPPQHDGAVFPQHFYPGYLYHYQQQ